MDSYFEWLLLVLLPGPHRHILNLVTYFLQVYPFSLFLGACGCVVGCAGAQAWELVGVWWGALAAVCGLAFVCFQRWVFLRGGGGTVESEPVEECQTCHVPPRCYPEYFHTCHSHDVQLCPPTLHTLHQPPQFMIRVSQARIDQ
ncbi:hypothetical protein E2C01_041662 [Portunus trituberculatus]|uniref:Uncharacterized protein n=1 Tax=Portunus trituberculatus TaxID=210409 RepID=A0A5B7FKI4_PORTR|nr:hypothetical protein [Portunus trituberculatus]